MRRMTTGFLCAAAFAAVALPVRAQDKVIYKDIIAPIFEAKCTKCHGTEKAKGKLRLHTYDMIMKGGEDGKVIKPGSAATSKMVRQFHLPLKDESHMPPAEKPQLTKAEIAAITWWIDKGASATMKISEAGEIPAEARSAVK